MRRLHAQTPCPPLALVAVAGLVGAPAAAQAQDPAPAAPSLHIVTEKVGGKRATILSGTRFRVRVIVKPFAPGQQVLVTMHRRGRTIVSKTLTVRQGKTAGQVLTGYAPKGPGQIEVRAASGAIVAPAATIQVVPSNVASGSRGRSVRSMQDRLKALGYVIGQYGVNDGRTQRAILAFRKLAGMARTSSADPAFFRAPRLGQGPLQGELPRPRPPRRGRPRHQVLALIGSGGKVERIYPTSARASRRRPPILGPLPRLPQGPGHERQGHGRTPPTSSAATRSTATPTCRPTPRATAACGCRSPTPTHLQLGPDRRRPVDVYDR